MIRIAAVGDLHYDRRSVGRLKKFMSTLKSNADLLLLAGDLTQTGLPEEAMALTEDLAESPVPVVAVFGNHDYHSDENEKLARIMSRAGIIVLDGASVSLVINSYTVGVMGLKGFGGGFIGACGVDFGEREMKEFIRFTKSQAETLRVGLQSLNTDYKIALTHYSPTEQTLLGEKREIYPFLGSYLLAEAIDKGGADIAFHGHAHHGVEKGSTPKGIPVRNVALPVIRNAYNIYYLEKPEVPQQSTQAI